MSQFLEVVHQQEYWNCDLVPFHFQQMQFQQNDSLMNLCLFKDFQLIFIPGPIYTRTIPGPVQRLAPGPVSTDISESVPGQA